MVGSSTGKPAGVKMVTRFAYAARVTGILANLFLIAIYALLAQPDSLPAGEALAWVLSWILPIIIGLSVFPLLLFPTGRLLSRRWRWVAWLTVAWVLMGVISSAFSSGALLGLLGPIRNPLGIEGFTDVYKALLYIMSPLLLIAAAFSLLVRFCAAPQG